MYNWKLTHLLERKGGGGGGGEARSWLYHTMFWMLYSNGRRQVKKKKKNRLGFKMAPLTDKIYWPRPSLLDLLMHFHTHTHTHTHKHTRARARARAHARWSNQRLALATTIRLWGPLHKNPQKESCEPHERLHPILLLRLLSKTTVNRGNANKYALTSFRATVFRLQITVLMCARVCTNFMFLGRR